MTQMLRNADLRRFFVIKIIRILLKGETTFLKSALPKASASSAFYKVL
jgi:hypothetical protein